MLGLASRRWSVNKLCQTFSIKAFRADNLEKYLTNNNNSSERELCGWVALLFSVCKWGQYLSASCFVLISSCSEISFMIDRQPWAPLREPGPETRKQLQSCWHQRPEAKQRTSGTNIIREDFPLSNLSHRIWKPLLKRLCDAEHESAPNCFSKSWLGSECKV